MSVDFGDTLVEKKRIVGSIIHACIGICIGGHIKRSIMESIGFRLGLFCGYRVFGLASLSNLIFSLTLANHIHRPQLHIENDIIMYWPLISGSSS